MMKLLRSGEELQVLSLTKEQYQDFKASARKQVLFAPFVDTKSEDGKVDVVIEAKSIPLVNHILDRIGYTQIEPEKEKEPPKKDTPSRQSSSDIREQPAPRRSDRSPTEERNSSDKPSVIARLEANRPNLVYTITVSVYTFRLFHLFPFTVVRIWLTPCFSLLGDNPE